MSKDFVIRTLEKERFDVIMEAFYRAFEHYYVSFPRNNDIFHRRFEAAMVDYSYSFGVYQDDRLVGFILHAIDERGGKKIAFNAGTGVVAECRGQRLVQAMYDFGLPRFKKLGVEQLQLEVITENIPAINVYLQVGFKIRRFLKCYKGSVHVATAQPLSMSQIAKEDFDWSQTNQEQYSWENQQQSIQHGEYDYYVLEDEEGKMAAYLIINPVSGYIPQCDVLIQEAGIWEQLLNTIAQLSDQVKINNIDSKLKEKADRIEASGLHHYLDQFEMSVALDELI